MLVARFRRQGDFVAGSDEKGATVVRVPVNEPVYLRPAVDPKNQLVRVNCP